MRSRDRKKVEFRTGTSKDSRLDQTLQRAHLRVSNPLKKNPDTKKSSLSPLKNANGMSRLGSNLFGHRDSLSKDEDGRQDSSEALKDSKTFGLTKTESKKDSVKPRAPKKAVESNKDGHRQTREPHPDKLKRPKFEPPETIHHKKKPTEPLDDHHDLAKYVETQQKRMMLDSCKHAEKIFDQHTKRMKLLSIQKPALRNLVKKGAESLAALCVAPTKPDLALPLNSVSGAHKIIIEKSRSDRSHQSLHVSTEDRPADTLPFTKRNVGSFLQTDTPKNRLDVGSERTKKNKRSTTQVESLKPGKPLLSPPQLAKPDPQTHQQQQHVATEPDDKESIKKDYQINDRYKIMNFLKNDKALQSGKDEIKEKLRKFKLDFNQPRDQPEPLEEELQHLEMREVIGVGAYAIVQLAFDKNRREEVAVKFYERVKLMDLVKQKNYEAEVENLRDLDHPNIVKLHEVIETSKRVAMVMECISTFTLFDYLARCPKSRVHEHEAKVIFFQILQAVDFAHSRGVIHRDMKLQNLIVNDKFQVKLIDFGFSVKVADGKKLSVFCGTPSYMSPELVKRYPLLTKRHVRREGRRHLGSRHLPI